MEDEYTTRDIGAAAFIYLNGAQLLTAIDSRGYESFSFDNKGDSALRLAEQFYEDATAPARSLIAASVQLRTEATTARRQKR
jgi:hypothetical protein